MKAKCPKCKEPIELNPNTHDEGDSIECPECGAQLTVTLKKGLLGVEPEHSKYEGYEEEFLPPEEDYE